MPDYKQSSIAGTSWQRACRLVIENPLGGTPSVNIVEETAINLGDQPITNPCGNLYVNFDPTAEIALVNPETGAPTGEIMTHGDLYVALHSLYMQEAVKRDAQQNQ